MAPERLRAPSALAGAAVSDSGSSRFDEAKETEKGTIFSQPYGPISGQVRAIRTLMALNMDTDGVCQGRVLDDLLN